MNSIGLVDYVTCCDSLWPVQVSPSLQMVLFLTISRTLVGVTPAKVQYEYEAKTDIMMSLTQMT